MCANGGTLPSTYMVEIQQLKEDNKRLMALLRETKEYKEFAGYVEDSGGNVRAASKENLQSNRDDSEGANWIPEAAYAEAH